MRAAVSWIFPASLAHWHSSRCRIVRGQVFAIWLITIPKLRLICFRYFWQKNWKERKSRLTPPHPGWGENRNGNWECTNGNTGRCKNQRGIGAYRRRRPIRKIHSCRWKPSLVNQSSHLNTWKSGFYHLTFSHVNFFNFQISAVSRINSNWDIDRWSTNCWQEIRSSAILY